MKIAISSVGKILFACNTVLVLGLLSFNTPGTKTLDKQQFRQVLTPINSILQSPESYISKAITIEGHIHTYDPFGLGFYILEDGTGTILVYCKRGRPISRADGVNVRFKGKLHRPSLQTLDLVSLNEESLQFID